MRTTSTPNRALIWTTGTGPTPPTPTASRSPQLTATSYRYPSTVDEDKGAEDEGAKTVAKWRRQELSGKYRCVVRVSRFGRWRVLLRIAYLSARFRRVHSSFAPDPVRIGPRINKLRFAFRVSNTTQARRRRLSAAALGAGSRASRTTQARRRRLSAAAVGARLGARMSTENPQAPGGPTPGGSPGY